MLAERSLIPELRSLAHNSREYTFVAHSLSISREFCLRNPLEDLFLASASADLSLGLRPIKTQKLCIDFTNTTQEKRTLAFSPLRLFLLDGLTADTRSARRSSLMSCRWSSRLHLFPDPVVLQQSSTKSSLDDCIKVRVIMIHYHDWHEASKQHRWW